MRCSTLRRRFLSRIEKPGLRILDRQGGEHARAVSARVDSDPIRTDVHPRCYRMAVDDDESMIGFVEQKRLSDPSEVGLTLLLDLDSGPDSCVDEQEIAKAQAVVERFEELQVSGGDGIPNRGNGRFSGQAT